MSAVPVRQQNPGCAHQTVIRLIQFGEMPVSGVGSAVMDKTADYMALALILAAALYLFWKRKPRSDVTALLVTLALILPWPHPDGQWRSVLTYQEGF